MRYTLTFTYGDGRTFTVYNAHKNTVLDVIRSELSVEEFVTFEVKVDGR